MISATTVCPACETRWETSSPKSPRDGQLQNEIGTRSEQDKGRLNGGVSNGGGFPIWTCPSFFVLFCPFLSLSRGFSRFARGRSGDFPDWSFSSFLGLLRAPTRNSPERVRDTVWTIPEKSGKHPGLETPRFSFSQE